MSRVVLTGATRGLGRALALAFARRGDRLAVCARRQEGLDRLAAELGPEASRLALAGACDLSRVGDAERFADEAVAALGRVDVLINNASILGPRVEISDYPGRTFDEVMRVNAVAPAIVTGRILASMKREGRGSIINVSSSVGATPKPRWGAYLASKFALEGLSRMLAVELEGTPIRVNIVNPGAMRTQMRREAYPDEDPATLRTPEEILDVFLWLASDDSAGVSGERFEAAGFVRPEG